MNNGSQTTEGEVTHIRNVALLPGETINYVFSPKLGLTEQPPAHGQVLIATSQRVVAFCRNDGRDETFLVPVGELKGVAVKSRSRSATTIVQGILLALAAIFLYGVVGYWLTGRIDSPSVPVINMDVAPLLILLLALLGASLVGKHYFIKDDGSVTFHGSNWNFGFPYRGDRAGQDIYQLVNSVFATRHSVNGHGFLWED